MQRTRGISFARHRARPWEFPGKEGMIQLGSTLSVLLTGAILAACGTGATTLRGLTSGDNPSAQSTAVDWSRAETVSLTQSDFHFTPDKLELRQGRHYRLHLVNRSTRTHTFTSEPFFKAIQRP